MKPHIAINWILIAMLLGFLAIRAHAQQYAFEVSAGADAATAPHTHGDFGLLICDAGYVNCSYSKVIAKGPSTAGAPGTRFTYSFLQGYQRQIKSFGRLSLYGDASGGVAASVSAVSGAMMAGGGLTYQYKPGVQVVVSGRVLVSPADGGVSPAVGIGIRFTPKQ